MIFIGGRVIPYEQTHRVNEDGILEKWCNRCEEWFPCTEEYFYKNPKSPDGLFPYCKGCNKKKSSEFYYKDIEHSLKAREVWRMNNKDKMKQYRINYYSSHKDERHDYCKNYRQTNKEQVNNYAKQRRNKNHKISQQEWDYCLKYFNYTCAYCGITNKEAKKTYGQFLHREHAIHNGENDISNCIPACKSCNSKKSVESYDEWYIPSNPVFLQDKLDKINKWLSEDYKLFKEDVKNG